MFSTPLVFLPLVFVLGLCLGSFLNVVILRSLLGESWVKGRSRCDTCRRDLEWFELIPLFSFIILRGRCRTCHTEIDFMHPVVEILTGSLFVWWWAIGFAFFQLSSQPLQIIQALFWLSIGVVFVAIVIADLLAFIIPDWTILWIFFATLAYRMLLVGVGVYNPADLARGMLSAFVLLLVFLGLWWGTKGRGMGFGDVKLVFVLAVLLGWPNSLVAVAVAFLSGAALGLLLILFRKSGMKTALPFGPFLVFGSITALVWGQSLVQWYQALLGIR